MQPNTTIETISKTDAEWQKQLTPEQYRITRKHADRISGIYIALECPCTA